MFMVNTILLIVAVYALFGVLFAAWFVLAGVARVDGNARGGPIGFRLLIFPGSAALWPMMLAKCLRARRVYADVVPERPGSDAP